MTEKEKKNGESGAAQKIQFGINAQFLKDLSFESPSTPNVFFEKPTDQPQISVNVDVSAKKRNDNLFEVDLKLNVENKIKDRTLFIAELVYGAIVTVKAPKEHEEGLLLIETPRIIFPFARTILAGMTQEGGFPPLLLAPIDFVQLYQNRNKK